MKALILAGGLGTRLKEAVKNKPKPMALIGDKPFLEYQLIGLRECGIDNIVLCVGYMWEMIRDYFGNGQRLGISIEYSVEEEPMGTAGAIKLAERFIDSTSFVLNGDTFLEIDYNQLIDYHHKKDAFMTLALTTVENSSRYSKIVLDHDNRIIGYHEKDRTIDSNVIGAGVYVVEQGLLSYIPVKQKLSLEHDVFPQVVAERKVFGLLTNGYFKDIGTPESYREFQEYILRF